MSAKDSSWLGFLSRINVIASLKAKYELQHLSNKESREDLHIKYLAIWNIMENTGHYLLKTREKSSVCYLEGSGYYLQHKRNSNNNETSSKPAWFLIHKSF